MSNLKHVCVALALCLSPAAARAAAAAAAPPDVLKHVPEDCLAFAVVKHVADCTAKIDAFLKRISLDPDQEMKILPMIVEEVGLGEGFNTQGGFAAVLLDPQQFDVDLVSLIAGPAEQGAPPPDASKLPLVLLIPGKDPAKMFAARQPKAEGKIVKFTGTDGTARYCRQVGDYIALSPNLKAVEAVAAGVKSVSAKLSAADQAYIAANDVAVWINFKTLSPILDAAIARMQARAKEGAVGPAGIPLAALAGPMAEWRKRFKQMDDASIGLRFSAEGVLLDLRASYDPESVVGKALAAYKPAAGALLGKLPGMAYALAFGMKNPPKLPDEDAAKEVDKMLARKPCQGLPEADKARLRAALLEMDRQVQAAQIWVGPGAEGQGAFSLAIVLDCKSAGAVRKAAADAVAVAAKIIAISEDPKAKQITVTHQADAETLGDRKVDLVTLAAAADDAKGILKSLLAGEKLQVRIAQADEKTLVLALGDKALLESLLQAAAGGKAELQKSEAVAKALGRLPAKSLAVALIHARNVQAIVKAVRIAGGGKPLAGDMKCETPFALGVYVDGADVGVTIHLPSDAIKEVIQTVMAIMMQQMMEKMQVEQIQVEP